MRASDHLRPGGTLSKALSGYEHRPGQLAMAEAVQDVLGRDGVLLVEAGTGTGKTLAYLLPAVLSGRRVVVSTGTKNLQDQIMDHDLPLLSRQLGIEIRAAVMKGLSNYLCLRRFEELRRSPDPHRYDRDGAGTAHLLPILQEFRQRTKTGDRADLTGLPEDAPIWSQVSSSSETRIGQRCPHYEECFVTAMRRNAEDARLIVVNHHLFFADLATRGPHGGILPEYDAVIFDEAHQIEDVVTRFFGVSVSSGRVEVLARDARRALLGVERDPMADEIADKLLRDAAHFFQSLPRAGRDGGRYSLRPEDFAGDLEDHMHHLDNTLELLHAHGMRYGADSEAVASVVRRTAQLRDDIATIAEGGTRAQVTWTELRGRRATIGASPVDVSAILREELFYRTPAVVLTSATLSTGGSFDFIEGRLGVDFDARTELVDSPFDFSRQAALYLPEDLPDPRDAGHLTAAADRIERLVSVTAGGAFVLCTSVRAMLDLSRRLRGRLGQPMLVQGEGPKADLLGRFREHGDAVLFATASFWEGVDVPGRSLRLVIIDKLPFEVPSDPLVAARCAQIEETGESSFMRYLVPSAALSLKQGFGRLVRTQTDRGIVAILDSRIVRKGYGKVFLDSLPDARRCSTLDEVETFWEEAST